MPGTQTFTIAGVEWTIRPLDCDEQIEVECILLQVLGPALGAGVAALIQGIAPALVQVLRDTVLDTGQIERALASAEIRLAASATGARVRRDGDALILTFSDADATTLALGSLGAEFDGEMVVDADAGNLTTLIMSVDPDVVAAANEPFEISRLMDLDTADPRLRVAWDRLLDALSETGGDLIRDAVMTLAGRLDHRQILRLFQLSILGKGKTLIQLNGRPSYIGDAATLSQVLSRNPRAKWDLLGRALLVTYGPDPDAADINVIPGEGEGE